MAPVTPAPLPFEQGDQFGCFCAVGPQQLAVAGQIVGPVSSAAALAFGAQRSAQAGEQAQTGGRAGVS